jgi:CelD/BcsL family acetyltransferase involved in cellulose biosynthesis
MSVHFELRTDLDAGTLAPLWCELERRADPPMFLGWHWIACWLAETGIAPIVLHGTAAGETVLLAVLAPRRRGLLPPLSIYGLHLHNAGREDWDVITVEHNGFLVDPAWRAAVPAALKVLLGARVAGHRRDELHIRNAATPQGVPLFPPEALPGGTVLRELFRKPSWYVDIAALRAAGTPYLDSLSANTRQQIRRSMRLYAQRGPLTATRARDAPEALEWLDEMKLLHQRYWVGRGEPGAFAYPFFERFQRRLISDSLADGAVELVRVACGDRLIGYVYNLVRNGRVLAYQTGMDFEADSRLKPGLVSHVLCIGMHQQEGATVYDFMAGAARYKQSMGRPGPDMVYCTLESGQPLLRLERLARRLRGWLRGGAAQSAVPRPPSA